MSKEEKKRRCKSCGKLLLDEKIPLCGRCVLEGRNTVVRAGSIIGSAAIAVVASGVLKNNNSDDDDDEKDEDEDDDDDDTTAR